MRRVLVTGGAGFIGSNLVRRLLEKDGISEVHVIDDYSAGHREFLKPFESDPRLTVHFCDLSEVFQIKLAIHQTRIDTVFHLAANPDIARATFEPEIDFWKGTYLLQNVLQVMQSWQIKNLVYVSGSGVYGEGHEGRYFREDHGPCIPLSTYGASKLGCEALIAAYCHMFGSRASVLRFANVVGPNQTHGVGRDFIRQLLQHPDHLKVLGDGKQSKSYLHVDDAIRAMMVAEAADAPPFRVFNAASDDFIDVSTIAYYAATVCGLHPHTVDIQYSGGARGWVGDVPIIRMDCSRLRAYGWAPQYNSAAAVMAGMKHTYETAAKSV